MEIESGWLRIDLEYLGIGPGYVYKLLFVLWESRRFLFWFFVFCLLGILQFVVFLKHRHFLIFVDMLNLKKFHCCSYLVRKANIWRAGWRPGRRHAGSTKLKKYNSDPASFVLRFKWSAIFYDLILTRIGTLWSWKYWKTNRFDHLGTWKYWKKQTILITWEPGNTGK